MLDIDQKWQCKWDHLPERLSSSTAVRPSCHPLLTPQEFLWSPVKTSASRAVIAPQEVLARPGTGAAAMAIPGVLQKLLLSKAETLGGTAASAWMMGLILKNLKNEEKLQHFHKWPRSWGNAAHQINKFYCFCLFLNVTISPGNQLHLYLAAKTSHLESKTPVVAFNLYVSEYAGSQSKSWNPYKGFV